MQFGYKLWGRVEYGVQGRVVVIFLGYSGHHWVRELLAYHQYECVGAVRSWAEGCTTHLYTYLANINLDQILLIN